MNTEVIKTVTEKYKFLFDAAKDFSPVRYTKAGSVTFIPQELEPFTLNPVQSGDMKTITPDVKINSDKYSGFVVRSIIGYALMVRLVNDNNFGAGCLSLSNIINAMLCTAAEYVDLNSYLKDTLLITFEHPWENKNAKSIFRELEDNAGYEIRLFISWKEEKNESVAN